MPQELCLIHANCQGDMLQCLLECVPAFAQRFTIRKFTNYQREPIPPELFARCAVFLYQGLDSAWGELASERLLEQLPSTAQTLRIPNLFFNGYWPLWTNRTRTSYGDRLLEHLLEQGLNPQEVAHLYLKGNIAAMFDLDALLEESQAYEAQKEKGLLFPALPLVREMWRQEQLFYTINHPGPRLLLHIADSVLHWLGLPPVPDNARRTLYARKEEFILPIHPQVGAHFGFAFAGAERRYPVYGQELTHAQYTAAYIHFKTQPNPAPFDDFIEYLQAIAAQASA